jgi:hypothetical protein
LQGRGTETRSGGGAEIARILLVEDDEILAEVVLGLLSGLI